MNLCTLAIILVLASEVFAFEAVKNLRDRLSRFS